MKFYGSSRKRPRSGGNPSFEPPDSDKPAKADERAARYRVCGFESTAGENGAFGAPLPSDLELEEDVKKRRGHKRRTIALVLACIALRCFGAFAALEIWIRPPETNDEGLTVHSTPSAEPAVAAATATATPEPTPASTPSDGRRPGTYTFLAFGKDQIALNTDTIMVGTLDTTEGTLNIVSIPRDTLANVKWGVKRINAVYANSGENGEGSVEGLMDGIEDILGFPLDNYLLVNIEAFEEMVDTVGGIYYDVPRDMFYDAPDQNLHIAISKGPQLLTGEDALKVVRYRMGNHGTGYSNGDIGRIETQHGFLLAAAKQMLSLGNIPNLPKLIQIVRDNVKTDLTDSNMAFYAQEFLKLDADKIRFHTLPTDLVSIRGASYVSIRLDEWLEMVNDFLNPYSRAVTESNVNILTTTNGATFSSTTGSVPSLESFIDYHAAA
jgi:LCP family protein required for cell wall assembly